MDKELRRGTPLYNALMHHIDALISGPDSDVKATLEQCLDESSLKIEADNAGPLLAAIRAVRSKYPQGLSERKKRSKKVVDAICVETKIQLREHAWLKGIATLPIPAIIEKLKSIPDEHINAALDRLLQLSVVDPYIFNKQIHDFLRRIHSRLAHTDRVATPVVVAYISHLVANGEYESACELIKEGPERDRSALGTLVAYLRFVSKKPADLTDTTDYSILSEEDLFLGACYYDDGDALSTLTSLPQWDYASLKGAFLEQESERALNDFKVRGLQPRIAELAFRRVYHRLRGANAADKLRDLNLECVRGLPRPWRLDVRPSLPPADWEDEHGNRYDVKSNLFYRSHEKKNGLRGFLIKIKHSHNQPHSYPGFVFTETDSTSSSCAYVGEYQPTASMEQTEDRVLPFCFRLPDSARYIHLNEDCDPQWGMDILKDRWLRIGWQLAVGKRLTSGRRSLTNVESLFDEFVERCIKELTNTFLECALWKALTETTLQARNQHDRDTVHSYLEQVKELISSRALPVRLPRMADNTSILSRWITDVLQPLNENWSSIQCNQCKCRATKPGVIQLRITRMTSQGTIEGQIKCKRCANSRDKATLLTNCHQCGHYPLIIGSNPACISCGGLVCEWRDEKTGNRCKACKKHCESGKYTPEEHFV